MTLVETYLANIALAIRTSLSDRKNFLLQVSGMIVNDGFSLLLWFMFFAGFRTVGGWQLRDVALLVGIMMCIVGVSGIFIGGYRDMAATILRGEIDALLTQPKLVLPRLLARESIPHAWGDLLVGLVLLGMYANLSWTTAPVLAVGLLCGLVVYVSSSVVYASLAFPFSGARSFARDLTEFVILFSSYPGTIYSGPTKLVAYTILPAGFVALAPVHFFREPNLRSFLTIAIAAFAYATFAIGAFAAGLRRYRRGAVQTGLA